MNNRKPFNKRGKLTREKFVQYAPEAETIIVRGQKVSNPDYPGKRRIIHQQVPKSTGLVWGMK